MDMLGPVQVNSDRSLEQGDSSEDKMLRGKSLCYSIYMRTARSSFTYSHFTISSA